MISNSIYFKKSSTKFQTLISSLTLGSEIYLYVDQTLTKTRFRIQYQKKLLRRLQK